jgi:hypothetical protein
MRGSGRESLAQESSMSINGNSLRAAFAKSVRDHWVLFLVDGIVGLFTTFWARHAPGFWWSLLSAALGIGAGLVLLAWPVGGAVSLTLVLIVFFLIEGIASIMYALEHRQQLSGRWGWMLASGIVDLILAAMSLLGFRAPRHGRSDCLSASICSSAIRRLLRWPCTPAHAGRTRPHQLCDRCGKNSASGGVENSHPPCRGSVGGD